MALDREARLSQSGVPSGLESSVSLAVLSVLPERAGALGGGLDWRRPTQHRRGKLHNGPTKCSWKIASRLSVSLTKTAHT